MKSGIYQIRNLINGNRYIGSAKDFSDRWSKHKYDLNKNKHGNSHLRASWKKYGAEKFVFEKLIICAPRDLLLYEQISIDALVPEYNKRRLVVQNNLGVSPGAETRKKLREWNLGKKLTEETRAKMRGRKNAAGKHHISPESHAKMAAAHFGNKYRLGKVNSPEHRAKLKAAWTIRKERKCVSV